MERDFITIKTFSFPGEVPVVQSFLEMQGIEVFLKNMTINQLAYPLGDIEMQVRISDYNRAKDALVKGGFSTSNDFEC